MSLDTETADDGDETLPEPDEDAVAAYLMNHPDFLAENPDLVKGLTPPGRWSGDGVVDMQQYMLEQMRREADNLRDAARHVIDTSRSNMSAQTRIHTAVLALLGAGDLADLVRLATQDLPVMLDVDALTLAIEPPAEPDRRLVVPHLRGLAPGMVDTLLGEGHDCALYAEFEDDGQVFGEAADLVRSCALVRLRAGPQMPEGLLSFGNRTSGFYHPGQGTELLTFLARVVERLAHRTLEAGG